jgi:DNA-directed RNA polymerase specialized sigma24 family protein
VTPDARAAVQQLVVRLADGDRTAITPAFNALWPLLRGFATAALRDPGHGEDAAQQAMIKLFAQAGDFDASCDAVAWAITITAFEVRTIRTRVRRRREAALDAPDDASSPDTPESHLINGELQRAAREVLAGLGDGEIATISAALDDARPAGDATFRKRLQRALDRLRTAWRTKHDSP